MSLFKVTVTAASPQTPEKNTPGIEALVDTGSELTWLPADALADAGIKRMRKKQFQTAKRQLITRDIGYAIVRAEGHETIDEIVFAEPSDMVLLGVRSIEGFAVTVDNLGHRFIAVASLVV